MVIWWATGPPHYELHYLVLNLGFHYGSKCTITDQVGYRNLLLTKKKSASLVLNITQVNFAAGNKTMPVAEDNKMQQQW